jgi:hypothetical protein
MDIPVQPRQRVVKNVLGAGRNQGPAKRFEIKKNTNLSQILMLKAKNDLF